MTIENARRVRADGARTRSTVLRQATELSTVVGLDGLSIGALATAAGMSKSGIYAHFGSKLELQLTTIDEADRIFRAHVIEPALALPGPHAQLLGLCDRYLDHLDDRVFSGGCFFSAAVMEMGPRPGPVRDRLSRFQRELSALLARLVMESQAEGRLAGEDPRGLVFEVTGQFLAASAAYTLTDDPEVLALARTTLHRRLG